jgi:hypothetical protein
VTSDNMRDDELFACLICGKVPSVCPSINLETREDGWRVRCDCPRRCYDKSLEKAIAIWNDANKSAGGAA